LDTAYTNLPVGKAGNHQNHQEKSIAMHYFHFFISFLLFINTACAQAPADRPHLANKAFDEKVTGLIDFSVPVISVQELYKSKSDYIILDTREKEEYDISHIQDAKYIGYKDFDKKKMTAIPKDSKIVLYCSVGYRSEKIGKKLQKLGYTNVYNLFGSIFEWVNQGYMVVDNLNHPVFKVHTYDKKWSQWVDEDKAVKVY
jgi:rhodanese-related sulfurtransferase